MGLLLLCIFIYILLSNVVMLVGNENVPSTITLTDQEQNQRKKDSSHYNI